MASAVAATRLSSRQLFGACIGVSRVSVTNRRYTAGSINTRTTLARARHPHSQHTRVTRLRGDIVLHARAKNTLALPRSTTWGRPVRPANMPTASTHATSKPRVTTPRLSCLVTTEIGVDTLHRAERRSHARAASKVLRPPPPRAPACCAASCHPERAAVIRACRRDSRAPWAGRSGRACWAARSACPARS